MSNLSTIIKLHKIGYQVKTKICCEHSFLHENLLQKGLECQNLKRAQIFEKFDKRQETKLFTVSNYHRKI